MLARMLTHGYRIISILNPIHVVQESIRCHPTWSNCDFRCTSASTFARVPRRCFSSLRFISVIIYSWSLSEILDLVLDPSRTSSQRRITGEFTSDPVIQLPVIPTKLWPHPHANKKLPRRSKWRFVGRRCSRGSCPGLFRPSVHRVIRPSGVGRYGDRAIILKR